VPESAVVVSAAALDDNGCIPMEKPIKASVYHAV
jgi:hypothetical protein